jgi:hypothetical protein
MSIDPIQAAGTSPTNPFHIARAYGVQAGGGPSRAAATQPISPVSRIAPERSAFAQSQGLRRLVAGVVPGGVDFTESGEAQPSADVLPMYRHPADRNAAATGVSVGRRLDVSG